MATTKIIDYPTKRFIQDISILLDLITICDNTQTPITYHDIPLRTPSSLAKEAKRIIGRYIKKRGLRWHDLPGRGRNQYPAPARQERA